MSKPLYSKRDQENMVPASKTYRRARSTNTENYVVSYSTIMPRWAGLRGAEHLQEKE